MIKTSTLTLETLVLVQISCIGGSVLKDIVSKLRRKRNNGEKQWKNLNHWKS